MTTPGTKPTPPDNDDGKTPEEIAAEATNPDGAKKPAAAPAKSKEGGGTTTVHNHIHTGAKDNPAASVNPASPDGLTKRQAWAAIKLAAAAALAVSAFIGLR